MTLEVRNAVSGGTPLSEEELATAFEPYQRTRTAQASGKKGWG